MARVAIDIRVIGAQRTGDETVFFELVKRLIADHQEHSYVLLTDKEGEVLQEVKQRLGIRTEQHNVEVVSFGAQSKWYWNGITMPFFLAGRKDIEVFHTQYILPFWVPARINVFAHIHDISFVRLPEYIGWRDRLALRLLIPRTMRRAEIITPSVFTKKEVLEVYDLPEERVHVIYNALPEQKERVVATEEEQKALREKYAIAGKYWLYVGTLQPRKNIPYLIELFTKVAQKVPDQSLVIVGNRSAHHFDHTIDTAVQTSEHGARIIFTGFVSEREKQVLYQSAELCILPSLYEGFGLPLLEAMQEGCLVVASDTAPHREVGGNAVVYFPLNDVARAEEVLYNSLIDSTLKQTLLSNQENVLKQFSWGASAAQLAELYAIKSR